MKILKAFLFILTLAGLAPVPQVEAGLLGTLCSLGSCVMDHDSCLNAVKNGIDSALQKAFGPYGDYPTDPTKPGGGKGGPSKPKPKPPCWKPSDSPGGPDTKTQCDGAADAAQKKCEDSAKADPRWQACSSKMTGQELANACKKAADTTRDRCNSGKCIPPSPSI